MQALAMILALAATTQAQPSPDTSSPGWVWITNESRYGFGTIERGFFREVATPPPPSTPTPPHATPPPPSSTNYGVDTKGLNSSPHTFATNDPSFSPGDTGRQVPLPIDGPNPTTSPPWPLIAGAVTVAVLGIVAITTRKQT